MELGLELCKYGDTSHICEGKDYNKKPGNALSQCEMLTKHRHQVACVCDELIKDSLHRLIYGAKDKKAKDPSLWSSGDYMKNTFDLREKKR